MRVLAGSLDRLPSRPDEPVSSALNVIKITLIR